ncbi:MAG: hypothetical protein AAF810_10740 [Cyanobacteria bacterium P01_D01_bin.36]
MNMHSVIDNNKWFALATGMAVATLGTIAPTASAATYNLDFNQGADGGSVLYNSNGTLQTDQWADWGLTNISGTNDRTDKAALFNTYDTAYNTSRGQTNNLRKGWLRDDDLRTGSNWGTAELGNVLIIQEQDNGNKNIFNQTGAYTADDEAKGGVVDFDFAEAVAFNSFSLLDIDDNGGGIMVEGQQADGSLFSVDVDALMAMHRNTNGYGDDDHNTTAQGTSVSLNGVTMTQVGNKQGNNSLFRFDVDQAHLTSVRFSYPGSGAIAGLEWNTAEDVPQEIPEPSAMVGLLMLGFAAKRLKRDKHDAIA